MLDYYQSRIIADTNMRDSIAKAVRRDDRESRTPRFKEVSPDAKGEKHPRMEIIIVP